MNLLTKFLCIFLLLFAIISCKDNQPASEVSLSIIPLPSKIEISGGAFVWNNSSVIISAGDNDEVQKIATNLSRLLTTATGRQVAAEIGISGTANAIILILDDGVEGEESYQLNIDNKKVEIKAGKPAGLYYGVQTLLQMMPPEIYKANGIEGEFALQAVTISDAPRFSYRGMHLDVSRNFVTKDDVKKYIDLLAMFKFNRFHWHLTDGAAWRIEIKKYPLLTQKTAFRSQSSWKEFWNEGRKFVDEGTPDAYGGYYTQDDIREVVAYAAERYITIIPEIEMPGHSEEVFVAYPQLSCSGKPYIDSDFCAGNDGTFTFIEDVLSEVIDLFPSEYIHVGGDEAGKAAWKTCPKCQKRIKDEDLKNVDELQSYFMTRVGKFLTSKNRKMIGWDEILEGGLAPGATVMVWRGEDKAKETARLGHDVIMTPGGYCYFDSYQADPASEPEAIGGYLPLKKVYAFEPVLNDSVNEYVIGGQANIWAEYIPNFKHVEYMAFPRAIALAETVWSDKGSRDWESFKNRLTNQLKRLDYLDVNYHKPTYELNITQKVDTISKKIAVVFDSEQYRPTIRYTLDGSKPTATSPEYTDTIFIDKKASLVAAIFVDGQSQHPCIERNISYHKALGKKVTYAKSWTSYPAGGETALTNGITGGLSYSDNLWQGFTSDMDVTIDLGKPVEVNSFDARFMQLIGPGVYMPDYIEVFLSTDGTEYEKVLRVDNELSPKHDRLVIKNFSGILGNKQARYVRAFAKKQSGFLFVDELVID